MNYKTRMPARFGRMGPLGRVDTEDQYVEDFWIENLNFLALAAAATAIGNIQVQADSAFKLTKLGAQVDLDGAVVTEATNPIALATINIVDNGSGRQLFSAPVAMGALFGNGRLPFILPIPRIFMPRSNIAVTITNYSAATTYNIRLAFVGSKIFEMSS